MSVTIDGLLGISKVAEEADVVHEGDFGIGVGLPVDTSDYDLFVKPGCYLKGSSSPNAPAVRSMVLLVMAGSVSGDNDRVVQRATDYGYKLSYERSYTGSAWTAWSLIYDQNSILGTVSQSGGVPTGAIIERGSNVNGDYVKFADGTLICSHTIGLPTQSSIAPDVVYSPGDANALWTYPAPFSEISAFNCYKNCGYVYDFNGGYEGVGATSAFGCHIKNVGTITRNNVAFTLHNIAIGRWF